MREWLLVAAVAAALPACASTQAASGGEGATPAEAPARAESGGVFGAVLNYIPDRIMDLCDILRFGVNAGPGVAFHAKATDPVQATVVARDSFGVGFQGLRHVPYCSGLETVEGVGTLSKADQERLLWHHSPTDLRLEVHPILAGAHVAVDPVEIADFILGIFTIDIRHDDH